MKRKWVLYFKWLFWILLAQFIIFNISASLYAYKFTKVYDPPKTESQSSKSKNIFAKTWRLFSGPLQRKSVEEEKPQFPYVTIKLQTYNGLQIDAWYAKPDSTSKGTVLLFHGLLSNKSILLDEATEFLNHGFSVFMVDYRAHGASDGHITTFGIKETEEVKLAWDYILGKGEKNIFIYGLSMGAVAVSKAIFDYNLKPAGVILEMPFLNIQSLIQAKARVQGFENYFVKPFSFFITFWMGIERGIKSFQLQTTKYVAGLTCPVLMQWGAKDIYVSEQETQTIFKAIGSAKKKLVVYESANHESLLRNDPQKWKGEVTSFLSENAVY